jgi:transposase InsO family protein
VFGLERFDQYTYGRSVVVQNDHKPLASILRKPLSQAPKRLQALMMRLYRYDIAFEYLEGNKLIIADTLSRAYLTDEEVGVRIMNIDEFSDIPDKTVSAVKNATDTDDSMQVLIKIIKEGWPQNKQDIPRTVMPYYDIRDTLSVQNGVVMKGENIVIPKSMRSEMKQRLHKAHLGYDSMLRRARNAIFWPGMRKDIRQMADSCEICQEMKPANQKETLMQHSDGATPWNKIGLDLFELEGRSYLVAVDYYTNFIEVDHMTATTSAQVITVLKRQFARFGIPRQIISDGGPQFTSGEFKSFVDRLEIDHITSSPRHQQSNGKAESAVKTIKTLMTKPKKNKTDPYEALLELRNTPRQDNNRSPSEMMFGRDTRSIIPTMKDTKPLQQSQHAPHIKKRAKRQDTVKRHYDKSACDLAQLSSNQLVYFQHTRGEKWRKGRILEQHGPISYIVETADSSGAT